MTSFVKELLGTRGFSLIPPDGLGAVISANPQCFCPLSLCWHTLGNKVGLLYLSGLRKRKGGSGMLVTIPRVRKRE